MTQRFRTFTDVKQTVCRRWAAQDKQMVCGDLRVCKSTETMTLAKKNLNLNRDVYSSLVLGDPAKVRASQVSPGLYEKTGQQ
jgi:hypothetical protein